MCQLPLKNHPYRMVARMTREMPQMRILKRPDLACVLGAAQAECGDDELNQAHGEDDDSQSDGGGVCRGLGIAQSHRLVHSHRGGRHSERDEGGAR